MLLADTRRAADLGRLLAVVCALVGAAPFAAAQQRGGRPGPRVVDARTAAQAAGRRIYVATGSAMPTGLIRPLREHAIARDGEPTDVFYMPTFASGVNFSA